MTRRLHLVLASLLVLAVAQPPASAQLPGGRYQARPGPIQLCGGFAGTCMVFQLSGALELSIVSVPEPGAEPIIRIPHHNLTTRPVPGETVQPFPDLGEVQGRQEGERIVLTSPRDGALAADLELAPAGDGTFLLTGSLTPGDFSWELGGVLFDWTGPDTRPAMRLMDGRFLVRADWEIVAGGSGMGTGTPVRFDDRSGAFYFFRPDNPELLIKLIDACDRPAPFRRIWFFAAGLTGLRITLRIEDLLSAEERVYTRPGGEPFAPILDTRAFPCPAEE